MFPAINRIDPGKRMSDAVVYNGFVFVAGQVGEAGADITEQCRTALAAVDEALEKAGTDKSRILQTTIWLADMADFAAMNAVWEEWVVPGQTPARATGEAKLADPSYKVEFIVIAAAK
ncbi:RidA family protein [Mangrovicella endophytica]|uniref:RidA family protein n=1 Tax=Mangrovicella endophytica TaxID=2066697 RepID=UPI000C9E21D4|nr:RidA family protein [Mangrovicella endophytica]